MRFRTLLFFISAAAVTIPCLVMGWFQYTAVEREFAEDDRTRAEISLLVSERLEAKVDNAVSLVTAAAEILKSEEGVPTEIRRAAQGFPGYPEYAFRQSLGGKHGVLSSEK